MSRKQCLVIVLICLALNFAPGLCEAKKKVKVKPVSTPVQAQPSESEASYTKTLGVGLVLGDPIGVNAKYWLDSTQALSASVGSSLGPSGLGFYGDYLYHFYPFSEAPEVPIYVGGGAFVGNSNSLLWTGVRGVAGVSYIFKEPFDVFMEIYPRFVFTPNPSFDVTLAIGGRVYFNLRQE